MSCPNPNEYETREEAKDRRKDTFKLTVAIGIFVFTSLWLWVMHRAAERKLEYVKMKAIPAAPSTPTLEVK